MLQQQEPQDNITAFGVIDAYGFGWHGDDLPTQGQNVPQGQNKGGVRERKHLAGCLRCRGVKVRCVYKSGTPPCVRCLHTGNACVVPERRTINEVRASPDDIANTASTSANESCARCKALKIRCVYKSDVDPCLNCLNGEHECVVPGKPARRKSPNRAELVAEILKQAETIEKLTAQLKAENSNIPSLPSHDLKTIAQSPDPFMVLEKLHQTNVSAVAELLHSEAMSATNDEERHHYRKRLRLLANEHHVLPPSFFVSDVTRDSLFPLRGGGFADIYKGKLGGKPVCLKVLRMQVQSDSRIRDKLVAITEIAAGLSYLHSLTPEIVHGDIKGGNVLVDDDEQCCLADFGLARTITESTMNNTSSPQGSTRWMAPEAFPRIGDATSASPSLEFKAPRDIYAFACTVLEIITGKPPFAELNDIQALFQVTIYNARPERPANVWCPDAVWSLVERCWDGDWEKRPVAETIHNHLQYLASSARGKAVGFGAYC
ncbi:hypothetical protein V5O48_014688 [Marasmius crinis-equi]|uniref:Kinase-like protein n=1 Tax=Marasmius crinis-equi TaxID=585013 RepID=A0ABR3EWK7_9AGAR